MFFRKKTPMEHFLTEENKAQIVNAIQQSERHTSGEIRVHIESGTQKMSALDRAVEVFYDLGMQKTQLRNGVLVYVAFDNRQFAIIGDQGIHEKVGEHFWEHEKEVMTGYFQQEDILGGIVYFIHQIGEKLKKFFPYQKDDMNELRDDISIGEEFQRDET